MNFWYALVVSVSMWTSGAAVQYGPPVDTMLLDDVVLTEVSATIGYGPMYGYTSILTSMYPADGRVSFSPIDNTYVIGGGLKLGALDIGIEHECWHPMIAYQWVPNRSQVIPNYEGGGTRVFAKITIEGGSR